MAELGNAEHTQPDVDAIGPPTGRRDGGHCAVGETAGVRHCRHFAPRRGCRNPGMYENACRSIRCGVGEHTDASTILISPESMEARYRPASPAGVPVSVKLHRCDENWVRETEPFVSSGPS